MVSRLATLLALTSAASLALAGGAFAPKYAANSNTVYGYQDPSTCLVWYRKPNVNGALKYQSGAAAQVQALQLGGYTDWRLPSLAELQGLNLALSGTAPSAFVQGPFDAITPGKYWTNTVVSVQVATVDVRTGLTGWHELNGAAAYTWPVRHEACAGTVVGPA